ncbi:hypothetical protein [Acetobacter sp.]|uniref:hypothetical protein n=1 Tax=Acetobacter sp. TaxID=440 RepID=UPI0039EC4496
MANDSQGMGVGFDQAPPSASTVSVPPPPLGKPSPVTPDEVAEAIEDRRDRRKLRQDLFSVFMWVAVGWFLFLPVATFYLITSDVYVQELKTENIKATVATSAMVAMVTAIPFTIFVTLAKLAHPPEKTLESKDEKRIETSITSLITSLADVIGKFKDILKK